MARALQQLTARGEPAVRRSTAGGGWWQVGGGWWTSSPPVVGRWWAGGGPAVTSLTSVPQPDVVDIENYWRLWRNHLLQVFPSPPITADFWPEWLSPPNHQRWPPAVCRHTSSLQPTHHLDNRLIFGQFLPISLEVRRPTSELRSVWPRHKADITPITWKQLECL